MSDKPSISKQEIIDYITKETGSVPSWADTPVSKFTDKERNEYQKYYISLRNKKEKIKQSEKEFYVQENEWSEEEKKALVSHTAKKVMDNLLTPEEKEQLNRRLKQDELIENYIKSHHIKDQQHLNYAIEHDPKFKLFLEKSGRLKELYTGKHIYELEKKKEELNLELEKESKKDKRKRIFRKFKKKKFSNEFFDSKKELDLTPYRNKKLESQGFILCFYLRKNGRIEARYVKMDELGQIKIDGYVYHEKDSTYRIGKKNDPVLIIMEGALVPINKEMLKDNLGMDSAEAQKLVIKGIEQAEIVKSATANDEANKTKTPSKWAIGIGIIIIIGLYMFLGGKA